METHKFYNIYKGQRKSNLERVIIYVKNKRYYRKIYSGYD